MSLGGIYAALQTEAGIQGHFQKLIVGLLEARRKMLLGDMERGGSRASKNIELQE